MKKKLKFSELTVQSFVTTLNDQNEMTVKGGVPITYHDPCSNIDICIKPPIASGVAGCDTYGNLCSAFCTFRIKGNSCLTPDDTHVELP